MNSVTKVPSDAICRVANVSVKQYKKIVWHTINIVVRYSIPIEEYYDLIHTIVDQCTDPDGNFIFAVFDFAFRANVVSSYSNVELPTDHADMFEVLYATDLYAVVCKNANAEQIRSIETAALRSAVG